MPNQFIDRLKSLFSVAKQLKLKGVITGLQAGAEFSQLIKPIGERPLILAPHPGDEVMAMGGTMALYAKSRVQLRVLTLTAGCRGTNTGRLSRALGPKRKREQIKGFEEIGVVTPTWWSLDENFTITDDMVSEFLDYVDDLNPDVIYLPSILDDHSDSRSAVELVYKTLPRLPKSKLRELWIGQYELWTPLVPNKLLYCDEVIAKKEAAIKCHESQLLCRDYLGAMLGLSRYRAAMLGFGSNAEGFFMTKAPEFLAIAAPTGIPVAEMI